MCLKIIIYTVLTFSVINSVAVAGDSTVDINLSNTVQSMKNQIHLLEERVASYSSAGKNSDRFNGIELNGVLEVEAGHNSPYAGNDTSDIVPATMELTVNASNINNWVSVSISALHEDDDTDPWVVDQSIVIIGNTDVSPVYVSLGRMYLPFGNFSSNVVSDPLTLEIGEIGEAALQLGYESSGFFGSIFVFNGDTSSGADDIEHYGANLGMMNDVDGVDYEVGISYLNSIAESDGVQSFLDASGISTVLDNVAAWSAYGIFNMGDYVFIAEYLSTIDDFSTAEIQFNNKGAAVASTNIELAYNLSVLGHDSTLGFAYQGTEEALSLGLPEQRIIVALTTEVIKNTTFSIEWARDDDYSVSESGRDDAGAVITGTGNSADTMTLQLAVEF